MPTQITCLIPFYNEHTRLISVLTTLKPLASHLNFLCVNDGSTDNTVKLLKKHFPTVPVLHLPHNQGKSGAIKAGLDHVTTPWVLLLDADLQNLSASDFAASLDLFTQKQKYLDMIILRRSRYSRFVTAIRHDILMSGERILRTKDLREMFARHAISNYQLEVACNYYMQKNKKRCFWIQTSTVNTYKITKWGVRNSFSKYYDELTGYVSFAGVGAYLNQLFFFCHRSLYKMP